MKKYVKLYVLKSIYYSLIYSHIVYATQVWTYASNANLDKNSYSVKKVVRMMTNNYRYPQIPATPLNPSNHIFMELRILKIHEVIKL